MTLRAIVFDMDGVLVDSEPVHFEATRLLLLEHGVTYAPDEKENFYGCTDLEVFRQLRERYRLPADERDLAEAWVTRAAGLLAHRMVPMAGVPEVLRQLQAEGWRLALASSSSPAIIETTIAGLGLAGMFETTVSGRDVAEGKPAPDIFLEAVRRLGLRPDRCLVVEDSYNGLQAARAAGIPCIVIPCQSTAGQDFSGATARLASLHELADWLHARESPRKQRPEGRGASGQPGS
jgi:HAD superfamily hydrolase (TIGR01509 family)